MGISNKVQVLLLMIRDQTLRASISEDKEMVLANLGAEDGLKCTL